MAALDWSVAGRWLSWQRWIGWQRRKWLEWGWGNAAGSGAMPCSDTRQRGVHRYTVSK